MPLFGHSGVAQRRVCLQVRKGNLSGRPFGGYIHSQQQIILRAPVNEFFGGGFGVDLGYCEWLGVNGLHEYYPSVACAPRREVHRESAVGGGGGDGGHVGHLAP